MKQRQVVLSHYTSEIIRGEALTESIRDDLVDEHEDDGSNHPAVIGQNTIHVVCTAVASHIL